MPVVEITSNEIYFNVPTNSFGGCIGIGTTIPQAQLHVNGTLCMQGDILPFTCNVYDLGSSNYRFRDLYLSGSTIDLEGVQITKDPSTNGGISIKDMNENYLGARVGNLVAAGNIGIGTTIATTALDVVGTAKASKMLAKENVEIVSSSDEYTYIKMKNPTSEIQVGTNTSTDAAAPYGSYIWNYTNGDMQFGINNTEGLRIATSGNVGIGTTIPKSTLHVVGTMSSTSVGIGTTSSTFPLRIEADYTYSTGSYKSIPYQNYMSWDAFANKIPLTRYGNTDTGRYLLPDFGFDFLINGVNYRSATYVVIDGFITFGGYVENLGPDSGFAFDNDSTIPAIVLGVCDHVINSASYFIGTYNSEQAIYIFYDARVYDFPSYLIKWCVVLQPNGKVYVFINTIQTDIDSQLGFLTGDNATWLVQLPRNQTMIDPALTNTAYEISIYQNRKVASKIQGNIHVTDALYVSSIGQGSVIRYPPIGLTANTSTISNEVYGNGQYIVTQDLYNNTNNQYVLFDYNDGTSFTLLPDQWGNGGLYTGSISTSFFDINNNVSSVNGMWIQLQLPVKTRLHSYGVLPTQFAHMYAPRTYVLLGSSDGNTWHLIDDRRNIPTSYPDTTEVIHTVLISSLYKYYRFVVTSALNGYYPYWSGLRFYAYNDPLEINNHMTVVGSVGIGTTTPTTPLHVVGDMSIQGHILPTACNVYDLGSANFRFRDLYLSGTTIDLEGTQIAKDSTTGGISVTDSVNGGLVDTSTRNLIAEGNVGIGTTNPSARVHIYHTAATDILRVDDEHVDTTPFIINQYGNLGIGVANPTQKLHVSGNSRLEGDLVVTNNITANTMISSNLYVVGDIVTMNTLSSNTEQMVITNAGTGPALKVIQTGLMSIHTIAEFVDAEDGTAMIITNGGNIGIGTTNALAKTHIYHTGTGDILRVDDETATDTTPFLINQDGSVGIGTNNPLQKLQVNGNINVASSGNILMNTTAWDNGKVQFSSSFAGASSTTAFFIQRGGTDSTKNHLVLHGDSTLADGGIHFMTNGSVSRMFINASTGDVGIGTSTALAKTHIYHTGTGDILRVDDSTAPDTSPFIINQDGSVGIGTNNPLQKLQVNGSVSVASSGNILMNTTAWDNGKVQFNSSFAGASSSSAFYLQRGGSDATKNHLVIHSDSALADGGIHFMTNFAVSRMFINASTGNVGIGTATALAKTHIYHTGTGDILRVDDETAPDGTPFVINQDGNVGIGTNNPLIYKLAVNGSIYATGDVSGFGTLSDARMKENIIDIESSLPQIRALRPVDFRWKSNIYYEPRQGSQDVGLIAQEVEQVLPLVVRKFIPPGVEEELKGVAYEKLTPYIVKAIQELDCEVQKLRQQVLELQK